MLRRAPIAIVSLFLIACGSSSGGGNKGGSGGSGGNRITFDGGGLTTGVGGTGGSGTGTGGTQGTGNTAGATPTGSLVFQGTSTGVLDLGPSCTGEEGATGDRWCAFFAATELYVFNATKATGGVSITCGMAGETNCLKLTSAVFEDDLHPALFQGDTLAYFDSTGTPFAWRPGMTAGRKLAVADAATMDVVLCIPDVKGNAVTCLKDLPASMQTNTQILLSDLLAGRVDAAADPPLVKVETVIAASAVDRNVVHFQAGFPVPGGNQVAWSARGVAGGPEILKMQTMGDDASRVTVATNVNSWQASPDGTRWYWLSAVSESTRAGTLQSAPFPAGTSPTMVAATTLQYAFPTPTTLVLNNTGKQLLAFADPVGAPTTSQPLDTAVIGLVNVSKQGQIAYAKAVVTSGQTQWTDLYVKKVDGTGACTVISTTDGFPAGFAFTASSSGAAWIQRTPADLFGQFTRLSDCMSMPLGAGVVWTAPAGDRGIMYIDSTNTAGLGVLHFRAVTAEGALSGDPAVMVSGLVGSIDRVSGPALDAILYTVNGGGNDDGVYVRSF